MKNIIKSIKGNYLLVAGAILTGLLLGWIFFHDSNQNGSTATTEELHEGHDHSAEDPAIWTCSMHPQVKQDKPGKCPICAMDLVPLTSLNNEGEDVNPDEIVMSESAAMLASIQTQVVRKGEPEKTIYLQGKIQADERRISEITARFGGRIEKLFINYTGQVVQKGEKLATVYSPELVTAQKELLEARSFKESRPSLYSAARGKLKLWDLTDEQISTIEENGEPQVYFDVLSPITGTVTMRHVAIGDYVSEGSTLFRVIDLTRVWVMFDAYEIDLPWIKKGDKVNFTVQALPGKTFSSAVTFIDPVIDSRTRVAKVRVEVSNNKMELKPEMFVNGMLESKNAENSYEIMVPRSSVLWTGRRSIVYVKVPGRENPTFLYREIVLGPEAGGFYVVTEGLAEGEEIATNGVFKIDAAAQLMGQPSMMNGGSGALMKAHDHGDMSQSEAGSSQQPGEMAVEAVPAKFRQQLTVFYNAYLPVKDAFVESLPAKVSETSATALEALAKIDMSLLEGDAHNTWMDISNNMNSLVKSIRDGKDIEEQRKLFTSLNNFLYMAVKSFGLEGTTAYYEFCPMANDNSGGYWFSNSQEIRNPYFGDMMLTCGEVKEIIKD